MVAERQFSPEDSQQKIDLILADPQIAEYFKLREENPDEAASIWKNLTVPQRRSAGVAIDLLLESGAAYPVAEIKPAKEVLKPGNIAIVAKASERPRGENANTGEGTNFTDIDQLISLLKEKGSTFRLVNNKSNKENAKADLGAIRQSVENLLNNAQIAEENGEIRFYQGDVLVRTISIATAETAAPEQPVSLEKESETTPESEPTQAGTDEPQIANEKTVADSEEVVEATPAIEHTLEPKYFISYTDSDDFDAMRRKLGDYAGSYILRFSDGQEIIASSETVGEKIEEALNWIEESETTVASKDNSVYPWLSGYKESGKSSYRLEAYESGKGKEGLVAKELATPNYVDVIPLAGREARAHRGEIEEENKNRRESEAEAKWWVEQRKLDQQYWENHKPVNSDEILFSSDEDDSEQKFKGGKRAKEAAQELIAQSFSGLIADRMERLRKHTKDDPSFEVQAESLIEVYTYLSGVLDTTDKMRQRDLMAAWGFSNKLARRIGTTTSEREVSNLENYIRNNQSEILKAVILGEAAKVGWDRTKYILGPELDKTLTVAMINEYGLTERRSLFGKKKIELSEAIKTIRELSSFEGLKADASLEKTIEKLTDLFGDPEDDEAGGSVAEVGKFHKINEGLNEIQERIEEILEKFIEYAKKYNLTLDEKALHWLHISPFAPEESGIAVDSAIAGLMKSANDSEFNSYIYQQKGRVDSLAKDLTGHINGQMVKEDERKKRLAIVGVVESLFDRQGQKGYTKEQLEELLNHLEKNKPDAEENLYNLIDTRNGLIKEGLAVISKKRLVDFVVKARANNEGNKEKIDRRIKNAIDKLTNDRNKQLLHLHRVGANIEALRVKMVKVLAQNGASAEIVENFDLDSALRLFDFIGKSEIYALRQVEEVRDLINQQIESELEEEINWEARREETPEEVSKDDESEHDEDGDES